MANQSPEDSDLEILDESEDELNITTYFHNDIELSSDDGDDDDEENKLPSDDDPSEIIRHQKEIDMILSEIEQKNKEVSDDDHTEVPMDIVLSPIEKMRKKHIIACPVCSELVPLCKGSSLYDNLISACMKKNFHKPE